MIHSLKDTAVFLIFLTFARASAAVELVPFSSDEGVTRFSRSTERVDFFPLARHFAAQTDSISCAPVASVIVLNAMRWNSDKAPMFDLAARFLKTMPKQSDGKLFDPRLRGYDRGQFFKAIGKVKTEAQLYGEPMVLDPAKPKERGADLGMQLEQLNRALNTVPGVRATKRVVGTKASADKPVGTDAVKNLSKEIRQNLRTKGDYVLVNFARKSLGQQGGGHVSPLGAYDTKSDSFLMLDVNPARAEWSWVSAADLAAAMNTFDTLENRGYLLVSEK